MIVNGTNPVRQYIVDVGHNRYTSRSVTGAGLWSETLWSAAPGKLQPQNLRTDVLGAAVATGSACTATEVRATARFLCWSCGVQGPAGVFDLTRKVNTALPASPYLLGDNFLVHHDESGSLVRRDLGDGSTATPATFPRGDTADDRNVTWTVDKFGGDVAYADEQGAVHVIDPGTRPSAPAGGIVDASSRLGFGQYQGWAGSINATRPLDSWKLRIARVARTAKMTSSCATAPAPCSASSATARAASARSSLSVPAIRSTRLSTDLC
ncbi:hypothetical protein [Actinoplanes sp. NPDC048796]|uniref:hypothetical protein n=1 Tax=Actinoplanes sp. NPDC048796 TaxID=3155640 RepID=UPI0033E21548